MPGQDTWTLIQETMQAFSPFYQEAVRATFTEARFEGHDWTNAFYAYAREPEPLTVSFLHAQFPYGKLEVRQRDLEQSAERGALEKTGEDTYRLSERGRGGIVNFFRAAGEALDIIEPLAREDMNRIADLLHRVIQATETAAEPADKPLLMASRRTDPGVEAPASTRIDQYLTDLLRYRDDAHLAAWTPLGVRGHAWEAFTLIWRGEANSAAAIAERLEQRGYSADDYASALGDLVKRGWLKAVDGPYELTQTGQQARDAAEDETNRLFFVGWSALSEDEAVDLEHGLVELRSRLREMAADRAIAANADTWPLLTETSQALFDRVREVVESLYTEMGIGERGLPFSLISASEVEPEPVSGALFCQRFPYSTPASWDAHLRRLAERGILAPAENGAYRLTDAGHSMRDRIRQTWNTLLAEVEGQIAGAFGNAEVDRLAGLLERVVTACLDAPEPPGTLHLRRSRQFAPGADAAALARIDQYYDDLNAFRDGAHIAAFASWHIEGHAWEMFTALWRAEVKSAAEAAEKFAFRGHASADYEAAAGELVERGWIEAAGDGAYRVTDRGREIREHVEVATNRYFYAPWVALGGEETRELRQLAGRLKDSLKQVPEPVPA
jgi:Mn-dependent DtxR family transcriptional regulator